MARYGKVTIVLGKKKAGKTNETLTQLYRAANSGRKVLILDFQNEFGGYIYREGEKPYTIKAIYLRDIPRFTVQQNAEIVRIRPIWDDGRKMDPDDMKKALAQVLDVYCNGILLLEDINFYITDTVNNSLIGRLSTIRQSGIDLIIHYQLIEKAGNPKLLGNLNYIRLHKTQGQVERHEDKYMDKTEIMTIGQTIVNNRHKYGIENNVQDNTGQYFSLIIDFDEFKIKGIFTKEEAIAAINDYISQNTKNTVGREYNRIDRTGKKIHKTYTSAYDLCEKKLLKEYFIFK